MTLRPPYLSRDSILSWLQESDPEKLQRLWDLANSTRHNYVGDSVHLRGVLEFCNRCIRRCSYCGINADQERLLRYTLSDKGILITVRSIVNAGCQTIVLQSGENPNLDIDWMTRLIRTIKKNHSVAITLSLGEKPVHALKSWKVAGADRYLLKIETSNPRLFHQHHPSGIQGFSQRLNMLKTLQGLGYETGSGIIVGLPGQTFDDLADDLLLLQELNLNMIALGPYQPPLHECSQSHAPDNQAPTSDLLTHKCLALTRIMNPKINIPATAALAARRKADTRMTSLERGANVIMPNFTPPEYRELYSIYPSALRNNTLRGQDMVANIKDQLNKMGRSAVNVPSLIPIKNVCNSLPSGTTVS